VHTSSILFNVFFNAVQMANKVENTIAQFKKNANTLMMDDKDL